MARIKFSPIVSDIKGKLGNVVFQGSKSGTIIRERVIPKDIRSESQVNARNRLAYIKTTWQNLTEANLNTWKSLAAYYNKTQKNNSTKLLTPYELFMQHNSVRYQGDFDVLETTALFTTSVDQYVVNVRLNLAGQLLAEAEMAPDVGTIYLAVYLSKPYRSSSSIPLSAVRYISTELNPLEYKNISDLYISLFKRLPIVGEKILVKIIPFAFDSGWTGKPYYQEIIIKQF